MQIIKMVCDKCGESVEVKYSCDSKYKDVTLGFGSYNVKTYCLCPKCQVKYGLINPNPNTGKEKPVNGEDVTVADKLLELISEIVADAIDNQ